MTTILTNQYGDTAFLVSYDELMGWSTEVYTSERLEFLFCNTLISYLRIHGTTEELTGDEFVELLVEGTTVSRERAKEIACITGWQKLSVEYCDAGMFPIIRPTFQDLNVAEVYSGCV